jgi:hypothetical protein
MTKVACCVCGEVVFHDSDHVKLEAEFIPDDQRPDLYYAHRDCMDELIDPQDFARSEEGDDFNQQQNRV